MDEEKKQDYEEPSLVDLEDVAGGLTGVGAAGACATSGSGAQCDGCATSGSALAVKDPVDVTPRG